MPRIKKIELHVTRLNGAKEVVKNTRALHLDNEYAIFDEWNNEGTLGIQSKIPLDSIQKIEIIIKG